LADVTKHVVGVCFISCFFLNQTLLGTIIQNRGRQIAVAPFRKLLIFFHRCIFEFTGDSGGEVTTSDLLLGIWSEVECPGHKILAVLGFNDEKAKELEASSSGPGFIDG